MSEFIGVQRLGYTDESAHQDLVLGDEYDTIDSDVSATGDYIISNSQRRVRVRYVRNSSGSSITPGAVVKRDVSESIEYDVETAGDGEVGCGVADPRVPEAIPDGAKFLIVVKGPVDCIASGSLTAGECANTAASGKVASDDNTDESAFGVILEDASDDGDTVRVDVDFRTIGTYTP